MKSPKSLSMISVFVCIGAFVAIFSSCGQKKSKVQQIPTQYVEVLNRYNNLGVAYLEQGKYADAAKEFKKAIQTYDKYIAGHVNLGLAYYYLRDYENAYKQFLRVLELDDHNPHALFNLGLIYKIKGKYQQALDYFRKVEKIDPNDPFVHYNLGVVLSKLEKSKEAVKHFKRNLELDPNNLSTYYNLARELTRLGRKEEGKKFMRTFQKLQGGYFDRRNVDLTYQEQGKYGMAMEEWGGRQKPEKKETQEPVVKFVDVTQEAGLHVEPNPEGMSFPDVTQLVSGIPVQKSEQSTEYIKNKLVPLFGSGGAFADYDNDGDLDIYIVRCSPKAEDSNNLLFRNDGNGVFTDVTDVAGVGDTGMGMGCTFADYDNDGDLDLYVTNFGPNVLYRNNGGQAVTFTDVTQEVGVEVPGWSMGAAFADFDHDSYLDLYVANFVDVNNVTVASIPRFPQDFGGEPNVLYHNNHNGGFIDVTKSAGVGAENCKSVTAVFTDFDEDKDIDFYLVNQDTPNLLFSNQRDGTFFNEAPNVGMDLVGLNVAVSAGDYNGDGYMDLLITSWNKDCFALYRNENGHGYSLDESFSKAVRSRGAKIGWNAGFIDYDNNGYLDIFLVDNKGYALFKNSQDGFVDVTSKVGLDVISRADGRGVSFGDYDKDGDVDILVINTGGIPSLLRNEGGNQNNWVKVCIIGRESSNISGIGTKVEVKSGNLWQKKEVRGSSGYLSEDAFQLNFGLGNRKRVDLVRVIWPSGIRQAQANVAAQECVAFTELGKKASCPILFSWDGTRYQFVTDFLGAGFIGLWLTPGQHYYPDPTEYIKIDRHLLRPKNDKYSLRLVELMEEVDYFDEVKLYVIDHPEDVEIYPNERLLMAPPWPKYHIHVVKNARPPVTAVDDWGNDILPLISKRDRNYPTNFRLFPFPYIGYAETHSIVLDLGDLSGAKKILLVMHGWTDYWNSTGNFFAYHDGMPLIAPYLQVVDKNGNWKTVIEDMGYPAGLPKTMTLDLTDKFLTDDYRVKITTNMRIYWDEILVSTFAEEIPIRTTILAPSIARLQWKGFPKYYSPDGKEPLEYDYYQALPEALWDDQPGYYTRYGDVRELLMQTDDKFVIAGHGDEVALEFAADSVPELPAGWTRDFLLFVDGFVKEKDPYTAFSSTVAPLPFHEMSNYPYGEDESYPMDKEHLRYIKEYNTRKIGKLDQFGQILSDSGQ